MCPICGISYSYEIRFREMLGLRVCQKCFDSQGIADQIRQLKARAQGEREALERAIAKDKADQAANQNPAPSIMGNCYECGLPSVKLTKLSNGHSYCRRCAEPRNRSAMGLVERNLAQ